MKKETIKRGVWSIMRTVYEDDDDLTDMARYLTTRELLDGTRVEASIFWPPLDTRPNRAGISIRAKTV